MSNKIEIDIIALLRAIKDNKLWMGVTMGIFGIIGLAVAFGTPKEYRTSVMLAPETATSNSLTSNISSLASMVGMDMDFGNSNDAIYPELYPDLIQSTDFLVSLFPVTVETKDGSLTTDYYDYLNNHTRKAWYRKPSEWLANLVEKMKGDDSGAPTDDSRVNPFSVRNRLQNFITEYRTKKARNDLAYMERLFAEAREQYVKARQQYASFSDTNQDLMLQTFKSKQDDLENDMQLKYNAYTQIYEQLQLSKAKVQERTPAFTVVQSASVPIKHINKSKLSVLILSMFLGAVAYILFLVWKKRRQVFIIR